MNKKYIRLYNYSEKYVPYPWFSKIGINHIDREQFKKFIKTYGFSILVSVLVYIPTKVFWFFPDKTPFYLVYVAVVALSAWVGRLQGGFLTLGFITIEVFFLSQPLNNDFKLQIDLFLQLATFLITASTVSFLVDSAAGTNEIKRLKKQAKIYAQTFLQLHDDYGHAREEIKARDEFLSIASHELKTPLTSMLIKLHNMINSARNVSLAHFSIPELMKVLENAEQQVKILATMINDLLNVSLITTGHMNLECTDCDLAKITKDVAQNFSESLKSEKYKVKIDCKSPVVGRWDRVRIEQAITNLLSNAIKYGRGKPITIKVLSTDTSGKFIIEDQGIGIEHNDQKVLFDRFKRVVSSKEYTKGLGVGLYIAHQIIKAHGGTIKISSTPMKGSTFSVELPLNKGRSI